MTDNTRKCKSPNHEEELDEITRRQVLYFNDIIHKYEGPWKILESQLKSQRFTIYVSVAKCNALLDQMRTVITDCIVNDLLPSASRRPNTETSKTESLARARVESGLNNIDSAREESGLNNTDRPRIMHRPMEERRRNDIDSARVASVRRNLFNAREESDLNNTDRTRIHDVRRNMHRVMVERRRENIDNARLASVQRGLFSAGVESGLENTDSGRVDSDLRNRDSERVKSGRKDIDSGGVESGLKTIDSERVENGLKNIDGGRVESGLKTIDSESVENGLKNIDGGRVDSGQNKTDSTRVKSDRKKKLLSSRQRNTSRNNRNRITTASTCDSSTSMSSHESSNESMNSKKDISLRYSTSVEENTSDKGNTILDAEPSASIPVCYLNHTITGSDLKKSLTNAIIPDLNKIENINSPAETIQRPKHSQNITINPVSNVTAPSASKRPPLHTGDPRRSYYQTYAEIRRVPMELPVPQMMGDQQNFAKYDNKKE